MESQVDTWYGWIVVIASAFIVGFEGGIFKTTGQIYVAILESTPFSRSQVATTCLIPRAVSAILGVAGTKLCEIYSYRVVLFVGILTLSFGLIGSSFVVDNLILFNITFGILSGVGCGLSMTPAMVVSGLYFKKYRALAIGVNSALTALNSTYTPILIQYLLNNYNLEGTLLLWGGIFTHGCIGALLIRHPVWAFKKPSKTLPISQTEEIIDTEGIEDKSKWNMTKKILNSQFINEVFKNFSFLKNLTANLLLFNRIVIFSGMISVYLIFPSFAIEQVENITKSDVALFLAVMGVGDIISRIASVIILNFFPTWKKIIYFTILVLLAFINFMFQYAYNYGALLTCSLFYGIIIGCACTTYFVVVFDYFVVSEMPTVNALHYTFTFITISFGPLIAELRNFTGSYNICWMVFSLATLLSAILSLIRSVFLKKSIS